VLFRQMLFANSEVSDEGERWLVIEDDRISAAALVSLTTFDLSVCVALCSSRSILIEQCSSLWNNEEFASCVEFAFDEESLCV
jgi:hypothetical protein